MKYLNIVVEGSSEEAFVNDVLVNHFAPLQIMVSCRKILTGWNKLHNKPAKGGLLKYSMFKNDLIKWIQSDKGRKNTYYTSFIDLYAFPRHNESPYTDDIYCIENPYSKVLALEKAIGNDVNHQTFIPYVQLHEFESFIMVDPSRLKIMYPEHGSTIEKLISEIAGLKPEEINHGAQTAPSKRIIKYINEYKGQKAQIGPLVAADIGLDLLRKNCDHFDQWITKLENLE